MINYTLTKDNYIKNFDIKEISNEKFLDDNKSHISYLIDSFNKEYKWDDMFNIDDVYDRIKNDNTLFLLFYNNQAIGYVFFKPITESICFGYNLYVSKLKERPEYSAKWFYNEVSGIMLEKYQTINVQIEDWNTVVFGIVESIGYKKIW